MKLEAEGRLLRIFVGEADQWHGKPLYRAIVERARAEGIAGATVLRGIEGYGAGSHIHSTSILHLSGQLPVVIEIIDRAERIDALLPLLDEMVKEGLVTLENVRVISYRGRGPGST